MRPDVVGGYKEPRLTSGVAIGMNTPDPVTCRRALREISEIAAVAGLENSQMTDQEALQTIAAIADWVNEEAAAEGPGCGDTIRRLNAMTDKVDFDGLDDRQAQSPFDAVLATLKAGGREARSQAVSPA